MKGIFVLCSHLISRETHNVEKVIQTATHFGLGAVLFALEETLATDDGTRTAPTGLIAVHGVRRLRTALSL